MRRIAQRSLCLIAVLLLLVLGALTAAWSAEPRKTVTLRLDWYVFGVHAPFFIAQKLGYYEEAGLDMKILEGNGSSATVLLVGNGSDTFGFADSGVAAKAISEGVPVKVISGLLEKSAMVLTSLENKGIKTPKDLEGKTLGVGAAEALTQLLPAFLSANMVDSTKIRLVTLPPPARPAALLEGRVDAIAGSTYGDALSIRLANPDKKFSALKVSDWGLNILGHGLVASRETVEKSPETVRRFVAATLKGARYAKENPTAAVDAMLQTYPNLQEKRPYFIEQVKMLDELWYTKNSAGKPLGWQSEKDWDTMLDLLAKYGGLTKRSALSTYYTNDFVPQ